MPPITAAPQNTRTGLISWLVTFVILFVVAAIFAIYYDVEFNHAEQARQDLSKKMSSVASEGDLSSPAVTALGQNRRGGVTAVQQLVQQRDAEARLITGNDKAAYKDFGDVTKAVASTLQEVQDQLKAKNVTISLPAENLLQGIRLMGKQVSDSTDAVAKAEADAKAANDKAIAVTKERDQLLADKDKQIAAVQADLQKAQAEVAAYQESKNKNVADIEQGAKQAMAEQQRRADTLQNQLSTAQQTIAKVTQAFDGIKNKLNRLRLNPAESLMHSDGVITRVQPATNTVYINIGQGESVTPGLTFEVYDKTKPLPKLTPNDPNNELELPAGKASIEVIRAMNGLSECRIVRSTAAQPIVEGDLIENLVYDPNTRYNFVVYGSFDLAQNGTPTPGDSEIVRRLITQWGGKLQNDVTVDTDFIVLGQEPVVPILSEEDAKDPLKQRRVEEANKALEAYDNLKAKALQLGVPILNQNRFLYFIGYYDMAKR